MLEDAREMNRAFSAIFWHVLFLWGVTQTLDECHAFGAKHKRTKQGQLIRQETRKFAANRSGEDRQRAKAASFFVAAVDRAPDRSPESCTA
jgi:hypothetical protein